MPKPSAMLPERPRISHRDLPADVGAAFKRVSQIYGIPLKELMPFFGGTRLSFLGQVAGWSAVYSPSKHSIKGEITPAVWAHETKHSLQGLLLKREGLDFSEKVDIMRKRRIDRPPRLSDVRDLVRFVVRHRRKATKFLEPMANINDPFHQKLADSVRFKEVVLLLLSPLFWPALPLAGGSIAIGLARRYLAQSFFERHGVDGLVLISAFPPKKWGVLRIKSHEKMLVQNGFLKEHGGMTRKGIQLLREIVPRELVLKRAKSFNEH